MALASHIAGLRLTGCAPFGVLLGALWPRLGGASGWPTRLAIKLFARWHFGLRFRRFVLNEHCVFNLRGLHTRGDHALQLDKVYVSLRVNPTQAPSKPLPLLMPQDTPGDHSIWEFLQNGHAAYVVTGAPGSGKSTLLQHLALTFAGQGQRNYGLPKAYPLLLYLRDHVDTLLAAAPDLAELAQSHFTDRQRFPGLKPPSGWFAKRLRKGAILVLLDGLDEVADTGKRQMVSAWLERQITTYPACRFVITSRPQGYLEAPLQGVARLDIQPFSWAQVKTFARAWYLACEIAAQHGKASVNVIQKARHDANDLLQRLQQNPALTALTVNPLLLTMIAMVHRFRGQLPGRRVNLYAEICAVLLGQWRAAIGLEDALDATQKRLLLQPLAAALMASQRRELGSDEALAIIAEPLRQLSSTGCPQDVRLLKAIEASSGLLCELETGRWGFAHLSFQEYLTACHWLDSKTKPDWESMVDNSWWRETLLLYSAQCDATGLVLACLARASINSLALAAECAVEAPQLDKTVKRRIGKQIGANLNASDPGLRRMAAEVLLARRLRSLQRIDERTALDQEWLSNVEFWLYLQATATEAYPEHWPERRVPAGAAKAPCIGIRAQDAVGFCRWLSEKTGEHYRLPTPSETGTHPPRQGRELATWSLDKAGQLRSVWTDPTAQHNLQQNIVALAAFPPTFGQSLAGQERSCLLLMLVVHAYIGAYKYSFLQPNHTLTDYQHSRDIARALARLSDIDPTRQFDGLLDGAFGTMGIPAIATAAQRPQWDGLAAEAKRQLEIEIGRSFSYELDRQQMPDIQHERTLALGQEPDFYNDSALAICLALALDLGNDIATLVKQLQTTSPSLGQQFSEIYTDLLKNRESPPSLRTATRYAARKLLLADLESLLQRLLPNDTQRPPPSKPKAGRAHTLGKRGGVTDILLAWFWTFSIANARVDGKLPTWECLRIVRERGDHNEPTEP